MDMDEMCGVRRRPLRLPALLVFTLTTSLQILERPEESLPIFEPAPQGLMIEAPDGTLINVWGDEHTANPNWAEVDSIEGLSRALGS